MNVAMYPIITMTYCFIKSPPPGSICNCSLQPPGFNITFPANPNATTDAPPTTTFEITTEDEYTGSTSGSITLSSSIDTSTLYDNATGAFTTDTMTTSDNNSGGGIITSTFSSSSGAPDGKPVSPSAKPVTEYPGNNKASTPGTGSSGGSGKRGGDPDDGGIWPIIVAVIFAVVLLICIVAFLVWYFKKYILVDKCKVHPDGTYDDDKTPPDMTDVEALTDDKVAPLNGDPPPGGAAALGAVAAVGTGGSPSTVKKLVTRGSVELKPIGMVKPLPPIHKNSVVLDPSALTEPETDHPHMLANTNADDISDKKTKKKRKKKKKKKQKTTDDAVTGDTNLGYDNTEDLPAG